MSTSKPTVYLFAGDSLTEGVCGESYVDRVRRGLSARLGTQECVALNAGRGGDTVRSLLARIEEPLRDARPRCVILAIGTNDVWFRWLGEHSVGWWLWLRMHVLRTGQAPTSNLDRFGALYRELVDRSRAASGAQVVACTISPIGETLSSPLNRQVARLNGVIQQVALERHVPVADVWQAFVEHLSVMPRLSGHLPRSWWSLAWDLRRLRRVSHDELARRRKLHLTYDGIHLNSRGADLWAATVLLALCRAEPAMRKGA